MIEVLMLMLALVIAELAVLVGVVVWRVCAGERPSVGAAPPSASPTIETEDKKTVDFEKRWQDSMDQMMGYDMSVARRAVRKDADEGDE